MVFCKDEFIMLCLPGKAVIYLVLSLPKRTNRYLIGTLPGR